MFWIDIEDASGNRYGSGPIITATQWESSPMLSGAGTFSFTMPAGDEKAALIQNKRVARCYMATDAGPLEIGSGVIDHIDTEADENGMAMLVVSGDDLLRELTKRQVGSLTIDDGAGSETTTGPALVMAYAPSGWSLSGSSSTAILHQFEGESVLNALVRLAEMTGESFRLGTGRQVVWMTSNADSGKRLIYGLGAAYNDIGGLITKITERSDSYEAITRVYPYGVGNGDTRTTLGTSGWSPPSGYTINTTSNYIVVDTETSDSRSERYLNFKDISNSDTLAKAAYAYLSKRVATGLFYEIECLLDAVLYPGQTVRVIARQYVDSYQSLDVDDNLIIRGVSTRINDNGMRVVGVSVSNVDRPQENDTTAIINQGVTSRDAYTYNQPGEATGGDADTLDGYQASDFLNPQYLTLQAATNLVNERVLTAGTGVNFNDAGAGGALTVSVNNAAIDHDALLNFVANEHIDHSAVTLTAGSGLTGGGTIAASRTVNVGAGDGIDVAADSIAVDVTDFLDTAYGLTENANDIRINAGAGLTFDTGALVVGAGDGIDVAADSIAVDVTDFLDTAYGLTENANDIRINAGAGLTFDTGALVVGVSGLGLSTDANNVILTSSSNPGAAASILASDASGYLQLTRIGLAVSPSYPVDVWAGSFGVETTVLRMAGEDTDGGTYPALEIGFTNWDEPGWGTGINSVFFKSINDDWIGGTYIFKGYTDAMNLWFMNGNITSGPEATWYSIGVSRASGPATIGLEFSDTYSYAGMYFTNDATKTLLLSLGGSLRGGIYGDRSAANEAVIGGGRYTDVSYLGQSLYFQPGYSTKGAWLSTGEFGIGTNTPAVALHVLDTAEQMRLAYDASNYASFAVASGGVLLLDAIGNEIQLGATNALGTDHYVSQATGWQITYAGAGDFRSLYADELSVQAFTAEIYQSMIGAIIITKSRGRLSRNFTIPNTGVGATIYFEDLEGFEGTQLFSANDYVLLRVIDTSGGGLVVADVYGQVTAYTDLSGGEQSWTFTTTTASYTSADIIYAGSVALDYGPSSGGGVWEATVLDSAGSPYSQVTTWDTITAGEPANFTTHVRTGNLDGLAGIGAEYGIWAGQGTTVNDAYILMSDSSAEIANLQIKVTASSVDKIVLDPGAPYVSVGSTAPTDYLTGDGFWVGNDGGTYKMHLGDVDGESVRWNGSTLGVYANNNNYLLLTGSNINFYSNSINTIQLDGATGDFIFGQVATDKSNLFWDQSEGRLNFRGSTAGTVVQAYIDTDGSIVAGGGNVILNTDGVSLEVTTSHSSVSQYKFKDSSGNMRAYLGAFEDAAEAEVKLRQYSVTGKDSRIILQSVAPSSAEEAFSELWCHAGTTVTYMKLSATGSTKQINTDANFITDGDTNIGSGLVVGATGLSPANGEIWLTDNEVILSQTVAGYLRVQNTAAGYIDISASGTTLARLHTDRSRFYMNTGLAIGEGLYVGGTSSAGTGNLQVVGFYRLPISTELTISGGVITVTKSLHTVDTQGDAATDDLDTINGGTEGDILILRSADASRDVTLKDNTGNLRLAGDFTLDTTGDTITLYYDGAGWIEISRSDNA